ncbi:hypothetical protein [Krasilnikovia sp. MM14-A1259]|uniref:hypothetical protein n=1 Tax=Krasilnikovia sp. MM14-A1259 TaxID=3373539 RepID=UPI003810779C
MTEVEVSFTKYDGRPHRRTVERLPGEDEFAVHRDRYGYPPEMIAQATAAAHRLHREIGAGAEPFATRYRDRLSRV